MNYFQTVFVYLIISLFVYSRPIYSSVILNEVAIQPTQTVELYNLDSSISADISSWYIDDSGGSTYFTIPSNTFIPPLSCLVFSSDFNFNKSSSDTIRLINNSNPPTTASAILIDSYHYSMAPDIGYSFGRKLDNAWEVLSSSLGLSNDTFLSCIPSPTPTPEPTPTEVVSTISPDPTQIPTPTPTPIPPVDHNNIFLSEVFPYPNVGNNEWVELYNANSYSVDLIDWYIDDTENSGGAPKRFSLSMNQYEYKSIEIATSLFNNIGDTVRLLNSEKQEKDSMEYGKITRGNSIGRISFDENIYCEQSPSQDVQNNICIEETVSPTSAPKPTIIKPSKSSLSSSSVTPIKTSIEKTFQTISNRQLLPQEEVLGEMTTNNNDAASPVPYLSGVSFSYSALTIVSLFIKIKNA